jgi:hypothetical protein
MSRLVAATDERDVRTPHHTPLPQIELIYSHLNCLVLKFYRKRDVCITVNNFSLPKTHDTELDTF